MNIVVEQDRFIQDVSQLIERAKGVSERDRNDLEYYRVAISRYYNQTKDWDDNPELARANYHHQKDDLQMTIVMLLMHLGYLASYYSFEFNAASYLSTVE